VGPPQSVSIERDFWLFLRVGQAFEELKGSESLKPVEDAIARVARKTEIGRSTVEKAWKSMGGREAWDAANVPDSNGK
jgi:hypothetical protein